MAFEPNTTKEDFVKFEEEPSHVIEIYRDFILNRK